MKRILFSILSLACSVWNVAAQEEFTAINTGAANFLTLTTDARSAGMGGAGITLSDNSNAIFHNGAIAVISPQQGGFSYTYAPIMRDHESGYSLNSIGGFYKIDSRHAILGGFRYYHYPEIELISEKESASQSFRPKEWVIDLGYAYQIIPNLAVSATAKLIHSDMGDFGNAKSANAIAFDLGAIYQKHFRFLNDASWAAGFQVSNIGSKIKYLNTKESLPAFVKVGGSVNVSFTPVHRLIIASDLGYRLSPSDTQSIGVSVGGEYIFAEHLKFRGGYHYGDKKKGDPSYSTAGLGIHYHGAQIDFSWLFAEKDNLMRNSYWLSLGYAF